MNKFSLSKCNNKKSNKVITKPQQEEPQQEEQKFQIEIIDRLDKYKDRTLDKAIKR